MLLSNYSKYLLLPEDKFADFKKPEPFIPNSVGHWKEWIEACKTGKPTTCNFDYSGALTETNHLGNVAYRTGKRIEWEAARLQAPPCPAPARRPKPTTWATSLIARANALSGTPPGSRRRIAPKRRSTSAANIGRDGSWRECASGLERASLLCALHPSCGREQRASGSPSPTLEERVGERKPFLLEAAARDDIPAGCSGSISGVLAGKGDLLSLALSSKGGEGNGGAAREHRDACKEQRTGTLQTLVALRAGLVRTKLASVRPDIARGP